MPVSHTIGTKYHYTKEAIDAIGLKVLCLSLVEKSWETGITEYRVAKIARRNVGTIGHVFKRLLAEDFIEKTERGFKPTWLGTAALWAWCMSQYLTGGSAC